jgi:hypothetical protein
MTLKMPGINAKVVRDNVLITLIDVVQRFPQKRQLIKLHSQKLATPQNLAHSTRN